MYINRWIDRYRNIIDIYYIIDVDTDRQIYIDI